MKLLVFQLKIALAGLSEVYAQNVLSFGKEKIFLHIEKEWKIKCVCIPKTHTRRSER